MSDSKYRLTQSEYEAIYGSMRHFNMEARPNEVMEEISASGGCSNISSEEIQASMGIADETLPLDEAVATVSFKSSDIYQQFHAVLEKLLEKYTAASKNEKLTDSQRVASLNKAAA